MELILYMVLIALRCFGENFFCQIERSLKNLSLSKFSVFLAFLTSIRGEFVFDDSILALMSIGGEFGLDVIFYKRALLMRNLVNWGRMSIGGNFECLPLRIKVKALLCMSIFIFIYILSCLLDMYIGNSVQNLRYTIYAMIFKIHSHMHRLWGSLLYTYVGFGNLKYSCDI